MKKVTCINDKKLPEGAHVVEGQVYEVEKEYINNFGQRVYIILGTINSGRTKLGMEWEGYDSTRFSNLDTKKDTIKEVEYALN